MDPRNVKISKALKENQTTYGSFEMCAKIYHNVDYYSKLHFFLVREGFSYGKTRYQYFESEALDSRVNVV